jgi:uracil-DNA glycosylase family 4
LPFLHRHIALAQPKLIVLLGAVSVRHVLGLNEGIMRARGRWETYQNPQLGHPFLSCLRFILLFYFGNLALNAWYGVIF